MAAIWIYFTEKGYSDTIETAYISLSKGEFCTAVLRPLSGTYYADRLGNWEFSKNFSYTNAAYVLQFSHLSVDKSEFSTMIYNIFGFEKGIVQELRRISFNQTLVENLIYWATIQLDIFSTYNTNEPNSNTFRMAGDISSVFETEFVYSGLNS